MGRDPGSSRAGGHPGALRLCLGTAMVLGVSDVYYGLESPADGGGPIAAGWGTHPTMPWFAAPTMTAGVHRQRARDQFERYVDTAEESGHARWARSVLDLTAPD